MNEILYYIEDERGNILAKDMNMDTAMILLRALFDHYYNEDELSFISGTNLALNINTARNSINEEISIISINN